MAHPRSASSHSTNRFNTPLKNGMSPPTSMRTISSANFVGMPNNPRASCGFMNPNNPASGSGLTATILPPARLVSCSAVSCRGWFVPGF